MKVGDKVWVPVKVSGTSCGDTIRVEHCNCGSDFWVLDEDIQTITAEDYRNALSEFYEMDSKERSEIWGLNLLSDAFNITAEEFVGRLREYNDVPKVGQIWNNVNDAYIVVSKVEKNRVHYMFNDKNGFHTYFMSHDGFRKYWKNTGKILPSIEPFLKDLEGLDEKGKTDLSE